MALVVLGAAGMPAAADGSDVVVLASGLDNPRGVVWDEAAGGLLVAEAGKGGGTPVVVETEGENGETEETTYCVGMTGRITLVQGGRSRLLAKGPSIANGEAGSCEGTGFAATGPHDVALFDDRPGVATVGLGGSPELREAVDEVFGNGDQFGTLRAPRVGKTSTEVADLVGYEGAFNPDGSEVDSNPYGVAPLPDGSVLVTDAGGNSLLKVSPTGAVTTVAVFAPLCVPWDDNLFPNPIPDLCGPGNLFPASAVPTTVAVHDDKYYVGLLGGFPFAVGASVVFEIDPDGDTPAVCSSVSFVPGTANCWVYAEDLTSIVDMAFGADDELYVLQFADAGVLAAELGGQFDASIQVVPAGGGTPTPFYEGLQVPGGIAVHGDHAYVTNGSIFPGGGQLLQIDLD